MNLFFVFDVESIGLHGEGFAVGFVVVGRDGARFDCGLFACPRDHAEGESADRQWVNENIPSIDAGCFNPKQLRRAFWEKWIEWKNKGAVMAADCAWPVEAGFLAQCIADDPKNRNWQGPYPLHEIASFMTAAGMDPLADYPRTNSELPKHDPLADARQSARLLGIALSKLTHTGVTP